MPRVLITGEQGYMARHLGNSLSSLGWDVVKPLRKLTSENTYYGRDQLAECDATNRDALRDWFKETVPDLTVHAAALVGSERGNQMRQESVKCNLDSTVAVLDVCEEFKTPLCYISSSAVYAEWALKPLTETSPLEPLNFYNVTKLAGELLVRGQAKVPWTVLRPAMGFGNHLEPLRGYPHSTLDKLILSYRSGWREPFQVALNPAFRKPYVHMMQLGLAMAKVIDAFPVGEIVNIASPKAPRFGVLLDQLSYWSNGGLPDHMTYKPGEDFLQHHVFDQTKRERYFPEWDPPSAVEYLQQLFESDKRDGEDSYDG